MAQIIVNDEVLARFWEKVNKSGEGCWEWSGTRSRSGYGVLKIQGHQVFAHRLAFRITNGGWPNVMVCHRCDNPRCVRPDHLFIGTAGDNQRDRREKEASGKLSRKGSKVGLWLHPSGQWCKKLRGVSYYFGTDAEAAMRRFAAEWSDIVAGGRRRAGVDYTVRDVVNEFLEAKRLQVDSGKISSRTWSEYHRACGYVVAEFGRLRVASTLRAVDFGRLRARLAKTLGAFALGKSIQLVRTVFGFAYETEMLEAPIRYADQFDKPSRRTLRLERSKAGPRMLEAAEVWKLLDAADVQMRAMVLLGLNCAYGQTDLAGLQRSHLTARPGWLEAPRQKTGIARRAKLWPETLKAIEAAAKVRPAARVKLDADCVFITRLGQRWVRFEDRGEEKVGVRCDALGTQFTKLARAAGLSKSGFYMLRRTFRTVADAAKDQAATRLVMGHQDAGIDDLYREAIDDERIEAVCEHVRRWLLAGKPR